MTDCHCEKIDLANGVEIDDNLGRFSFNVPNSNWVPYFHTNDIGNGVVCGFLDGESFKTFSITELTKDENWMSRQDMQADIESKYNVIESGSIVINKQESLWNLVDFNKDSIPSLALFVTTEHPVENWFYTINLSVSKDKYGKKEICELENSILSFRTW